MWSMLSACNSLQTTAPERGEVLSWGSCRVCGGLAAVGQQPTRDGVIVSMGCVAGCHIFVEDLSVPTGGAGTSLAV